MSSTTFTSGTVIASTWLNDVNNAVYNTVPSQSSAAGISYAPSGTGAVTTTVQAKLQQTVSVKDFGAVGDGSTDDTAAIQAALNSGAATIVFPPTSNYYNITSGLLVKSNTTIFGYGATLKTTSSSVFNMLWAEGTTSAYISNVNIFGLTVIGNGASTNVNGNGIGGTYCNNLTVRDCNVQNVWGQGIFLGGGGINCCFENNTISGVYGDGIHIGDQTSGQILQYVYLNNNYIYGSYDDGIGITNGAHNVWVTNNTIDGTTGGAGIDLSGPYNVVCQGNYVRNYGQIGIRVEYFGQDAYDIQILNNTIDSPPANQAAINLYGPNNTSVATHQNNPITIIGNTVQGILASGTEGLFITGANNVRVQQNLFSGVTTGITLSGLNPTSSVGPVQNCDINDNTFIGLATAIGLSSGNNYFKTFNNRFESVTNYITTPYTTYAQQPTLWEADYQFESVFFKAVSFTTTSTTLAEIDASIRFQGYAGQRVQLFIYATDTSGAGTGNSTYTLYDTTNSLTLLTATVNNGASYAWVSTGQTILSQSGLLTVQFGRTASGGSTTIKSAYLLIG